mmetsp:Transcript_14202/g.20985  ORF Transcript_14202/g.20985 Transcript_14202/m.20985 type:complete len:121 (+) Transcript_14202:149-511(+)|eukprot:CAMPEP_0194199682 /NCGR_PEP_ID=MMETSP0156-20130528/608_1 /TAXON_ID=33649 /ORGANISM="Thalassionema nitzschioides, Strain L26-B" /LENGTH=120 /DNA_ID=CAMNT_0038924617 /DNA_START=72 /DNA_END=434 /DNA_ORIENTATION=-
MIKSILLALAFAVVYTSAFAPAPMTKQATSLNIVPLKRPEGEYTFDDGLTPLERKQRSIQTEFLTGSAKSRIDQSSIDKGLVDGAGFELPAWFSFVGSVAGTFILFAIAKASQDPTAYIN